MRRGGELPWSATPVDGSPFPHAKGLRRRSSRELGRGCEGIALIRRGIDELLQIGNRAGVTGNLATLAVAQLREGAIADALATVEGALNFNPQEGKGLSDTLRVRGEVHLKQGDLQLAETDFRESIAMAHRMGAKAWEARTALSLARLLVRQERRHEARSILAKIYGMFTEGSIQAI